MKNDPGLRARLVANAKRYVQENNWDARKHEYLELVDGLVSRKYRQRLRVEIIHP